MNTELSLPAERPAKLRINRFLKFTSGLALLLFVACSLGCPQVKAPPAPPVAKLPPPVAKPAAPAAPAVQVAPAAPIAVAAKPSAEATAEASDTAAKPSADGSDAAGEEPTEVVAESAPPTYAVERFLLMSNIGPLVIEARLSIDGAPHTAALEKLSAEIQKIADTDGDGRATWEELCACEAIMHGQYGSLAIDGENGAKQITQLYDIDRDGLVDTEEVPRFLTRNAGGSRSFSLRSMGSYVDALAGSEVWQLLDADGDGVLGPSDRAVAAAQLRSRDADDDDTIIAAELAAQRSNQAMPGMAPQRRRRRGISPAFLLGEHANWDSIRSSLEEQYALGGSLSADDFLRTSDIFAHLDLDKNDRLARAEFKELDKVPPHLIVEVLFASTQLKANAEAPSADSATSEESAVETPVVQTPTVETPVDEATTVETPPAAATAPQIRVAHVSELLQTEIQLEQLSPASVRVVIAGVPVVLYHRDTMSSLDFNQQGESLVMLNDANKNGYLEPIEGMDNPRLSMRYESVDLDGDEKVFPAEVAKALETMTLAVRSQIHSRAQAMEEPLMLQLDTNYDQRLDAAELLAAADRLAALDSNGDGDVSLDEVPTGYSIVFARGDLQNPDQLFTPDPLTIRPQFAGTVPDWFQAMDTSGDSLITPREFLGPAALFQKLDTSADGLLTPDEAAAAAPAAPAETPENKSESAPTTSE